MDRIQSRPELLGESAPPERKTTHISEVFIGEQFVYKFKRPVQYDFIDQRERAQRWEFCRLEVQLNRRFSKGIYLGVLGLGDEGLGEMGEGREPCVKMRRLSDSDRLSSLLNAKQGTEDLAQRLGRRLADFHADCDPAEPGLHDVAARIRENLEALGTVPRVDSVWRTRVGDFFEARRPLIEKREKAGRILDGHGDLRLDHVYRVDDQIQVLDCVEFNPGIRAVDPYEDLAFLTMGCHVDGYAQWGERLAREYVSYSGDAEGFSLLSFFELYRASVRAKIDLYLSREGSPERRSHYGERLGGYLDYCESILTGGRNQGVRKLVVVAGLPATGKSTYARGLSHELRLPLLSTDVVRKRLRSLKPTDRATADAYSPEAKAKIYGVCREQAETVLRSGYGVIVDGTFGKKAVRRDMIELAERLGCSVEFHEVTASESSIQTRLAERKGDPSDLRDFEVWLKVKEDYEPLESSLPGYRVISTDA